MRAESQLAVKISAVPRLHDITISPVTRGEKRNADKSVHKRKSHTESMMKASISLAVAAMLLTAALAIPAAAQKQVPFKVEPVIARHPVSLEEQSLRLSRIW